MISGGGVLPHAVKRTTDAASMVLADCLIVRVRYFDASCRSVISKSLACRIPCLLSAHYHAEQICPNWPRVNDSAFKPYRSESPVLIEPRSGGIPIAPGVSPGEGVFMRLQPGRG